MAMPWHKQQPTEAVLAKTPAAHLKLAKISTAARRDVNYAQLDERLKRLMGAPSMVGLAVGVVENGRITFLSGYGETVKGSGDRVTPDTVFRWASCSKGVAATMVAKLAEQGKIDLNAPVANYAPDLKLPAGNEYKATVGDLLSHRLGLYRNAFDNKLEEGQDPSFLRSSLVTLNATCQPGTCWSYQNIAYDASSEMVVRAMKMSYEDSVRQLLFNPIGMSSGSASLASLEANKSWARPHNAGRKPLPLVDTYYKVPAAGGINSDIKDMALWMIAQAGGMPDVLDPRLLATIHGRYVQTPTERARMRKFLERLGGAWYGYGWRSYDYAGHTIVGHRGGIRGYRSFILFDPQLKSGVVALWNSDTWKPGGLEFEVMDMIYRLPFRDWLEIDGGHGQRAVEAPEDESDDGTASGPNVATLRTGARRG
ncbi:class A beta-lactamase-related serine hydrolase [Sphingomonas ginkgonis]|uniref:Class A beta-lactamase-related serine hydrolase n=1 Tax=Sphingomonas ginkgonis TaxID=2315330 RepID=A0A3R9Z6D3_9SPHN|nr:serine hydrolase domain-containing protein [Sphingomonas ginkgonis]RST30896.1 class A beta-lactamase-related serine hydrolase [Sphingomonas ginkgonis]